MADEKKVAPKAAPVSPEDQAMLDHGWTKKDGKWVKPVVDPKTGKQVGLKVRN